MPLAGSFWMFGCPHVCALRHLKGPPVTAAHVVQDFCQICRAVAYRSFLQFISQFWEHFLPVPLNMGGQDFHVRDGRQSKIQCHGSSDSGWLRPKQRGDAMFAVCFGHVPCSGGTRRCTATSCQQQEHADGGGPHAKSSAQSVNEACIAA